MTPFATKTLPTKPDVDAPDGSQVRVLLDVKGGSMAHFRLDAGQVAIAVQHRTVDELWYVLAGAGEIWRQQDGREEITPLTPGTNISIPLGTAFQFRAASNSALEILGCTMPPWPGADEAFPVP